MGPLRKNTSSIESLREYFYSVHDSERSEVIELLSSIPESQGSQATEAIREMIQIYHECQWRNTRLQIIRSLSRNPNQRSLMFLFRLAQQKEDLPIAEAAIWSLGQSHHRMAALFLIGYYPVCHELLKAAVVGALGQIPDRTLAKEFLSQLPAAIQFRQVGLVKNLVLTLGELKVREALPLLVDLAAHEENSTLRLSALIAIGKIARDPKVLSPLEHSFSQDLFEYQLFTSVKTQIQFRSRWQLEDYLQRIFTGSVPHPSLPYELSHFKAEDVKEGLRMFTEPMLQLQTEPKHFDRLCETLARIDFPGIAEWYQELIPLKDLSPDQKLRVLQSISTHTHSDLIGPLSVLKPLSFTPAGVASENPQMESGETLSAWLEVVSKSLPEAETEFKKVLEAPAFLKLQEQVRLAAIHQVFQLGLIVQMQPSRLQKIARIFETILDLDSSKRVQARVLRALGDLKLESRKALDAVKECLERALKEKLDTDPRTSEEETQLILLRSCFNYLENCPAKSLSQTLMKFAEKMDHSKGPSKFEISFLRCIQSLPAPPPSNQPNQGYPGSGPLDLWIRHCLQSKGMPLRKMEALKWVGQHHRKGFLKEVSECLQEDDRIRLAALVTLKEIGDESTADLIAPLLDLDHPSLRGRALDALTALPGLRAKRLVMDHLTAYCEDLEVCEKVIRSFKPPETPNTYFLNAVDDILKRFPQHILLDGLLQLREKLIVKNGNSLEQRVPKGMDIETIDRELLQRIASYSSFDESAKSALRSAELPYMHREMFDEYVDKGSSVIEYCKAVDLLLEQRLGKKLLFPRIETSLHEFQNVLHAAGLNEDYVDSGRVQKQLGLEKQFTPQMFPLHKMMLMAKDFRTGKILREQYKTIDGLRAWAVILLLFARKIQGMKPLLSISATSEDQIVSLAKRLMALQDARNPMAHRQTVVKFSGLDSIRTEVFSLLSLLPKVI